ncbi:MAG TPA: hypothetical protein VF747_03080 [Blastocatellia bacterium]|jgi:TolA-binding protein
MSNDPFNEESIVRYLLGDLPEQEQADVEDRAFRDRQYLQRILAAESDLIDEYVRGELSDSARVQFESRFLASAERRRKVEFAKALASVVSQTAIIEREARPVAARAPIALRVSLAAFLRGISPVARLSLATAALLIVIGGSWLVTETLRLRAQVAQLHAERQSREQQERALEEQLAQQRQRSEDLAGGLQSEQQQRQRSEELIRELERQREESTAKPTGPSVVSFALLPGLARAGGTRPKLVLPQSSRLVRLQIGIEPGDEYKSFRVELYTQAAQQVWSQDNLSARAVRGGRAVVINLPAKLLGAGQYELALKGITSEGKNEALGYYYFDVLKKQ